MDLVASIKVIIIKNIKLLLILAIVAVISAVLHYKLQSPTYVSNFKTNNGFVDYSLFRSLTDFEQINTDIYDLPEDRIKEIQNDLMGYRVSYIEETSTSYSFTLVTSNEEGEAKRVQDAVLELINNNRFIRTAQASDLEVMERKLAFLKEKIAQLDSLMLAPSMNTRISSIPSDAYHLYAQQLDIEERIKATGNFTIIKPILDVKTNRKPILLFVALYLVLAGFIFILFSKKAIKEN